MIEQETQKLEAFGQELLKRGLEIAPRLLIALVLLFVGLRIIKGLMKLFGRIIDRQDIDQTFKPFLSNLFSVVLKAMLFISAASMVGIATTSFVAILGAAGLALGLAMQGSLQNFASGVMILIFKPFKIGDSIEAAGHKGKVFAIEIFNTKLNTPQNRLIIIPNSAITSSSVVNYTANELSRLDHLIELTQTEPLLKARELVFQVYRQHPLVLELPNPQIHVKALHADSAEIELQCWVKTENYDTVYFDLIERIKSIMDENQIEFKKVV